MPDATPGFITREGILFDEPTKLPDANPKEITVRIGKDLWVMHYRHHLSPNCSKGFHHEGTIQEARKRAEQHCQIMGYRLVLIRPMLDDLQAVEDDQLGKRQNI